MILTFAAALAALTQPAPAANPQIGCHPHPGKVVACVRPYGPAALKAAPAARPKSPNQAMRACHPDPSRNKGCLMPVVSQPDAAPVGEALATPAKAPGEA